MLKPSINLLQPELFPKKPLVSLQNVVAFWSVLLVLMIGVTGYTQWQNSKLSKQAAELTRQNESYQQTSKQLQARLAGHKANTALVAELDMLKALTKNKRFLFNHLTNTDYSYIGGFASAMSEFSQLHSKDISLENIVIQDNVISFSGIARNPNAVPQWLDNFNQSQVLSGKLFQQLKMTERDDKLISFSVSSIGADITGGEHETVE